MPDARAKKYNHFIVFSTKEAAIKSVQLQVVNQLNNDESKKSLVRTRANDLSGAEVKKGAVTVHSSVKETRRYFEDLFYRYL